VTKVVCVRRYLATGWLRRIAPFSPRAFSTTFKWPRRRQQPPRPEALRLHALRTWQTHTVIATLRWDGLQARAVFDGPIDNPTSSPTSNRCSCRRCDPATLWCSTTSPSINKRPADRHWTGGGLHPIPAAVQPRLQSHRSRLRSWKPSCARRDRVASTT